MAVVGSCPRSYPIIIRRGKLFGHPLSRMTTKVEPPIEQRILQVLRHLGLAQVHVAARVPGDWQDLATTHLESIRSLTLVCPQGMEPGILGPLASRLLVISGDQGRPAERARQVVMYLPEATL